VTDAQEIMKRAGHEFPTDYRSWVGREIKEAAREYRMEK